MSDLWEEIRPSDSSRSVNLRRADPGHPLDFFRGRDHEGRYIFTLQGDLGSYAGSRLPMLSSLDIALSQNDSGGTWSFSITLLDHSHADIFRALCANLMEATEKLEPEQHSVAVEVIVARLRRWQQLLRTLREKLLSRAQVIGIFGELLFLRDVFLPSVSPLGAVSAWRGPHLDEQDFLLGEWMIEVKSQLSSSDSKLQISSENQLDTSSGNILICHQTLGVGQEGGDDVHSLNSLVSEIMAGLAPEPAAIDRFQWTLIEYGYETQAQYDTERWTLNERSFFNVTPGFPRITPGMLPSGIEGVRYDIKVNACQPFKVSDGEAADWVFGADE